MKLSKEQLAFAEMVIVAKQARLEAWVKCINHWLPTARPK